MSFEQLEAFVTTHREGSFSAAARKCGKAQSVISTLISNLEIDLGVELFDRSKRYPTLTEAGQALVSQASLLLGQHDRLLASADALSLKIESRVTFAMAHHVKLANLGEIIARFAQVFPSVDIDIQSGSVGEIQHLIREGTADLGVILEPETTPVSFDFKSLGSLQLVCVCCEDNPLTELPLVSMEDLKIHRQILLEESENPQLAMLKASPHVWQVSRIDEAIDLLKAGIGWSALPVYAVDGLVRKGSLKILPLQFEFSNYIDRGVDLIWSIKHPMGQAATQLRDFLADSAIIQNSETL